ncbi:MAG TPA: sugar phosphate isomerase/epimerase family protein [Verrucomicrobiota bacterium]|nr:sugar phosphate isomerase/epimerase family protein [Verrucomicrobiota bacterium]
MNRRSFLNRTGLLGAGLCLAPAFPTLGGGNSKRLPFMISLAEWSLHRALKAKTIDHLDFPRIAKRDYGIEAIELVNQFFPAKARDRAYLADFKKRADDAGVKTLLIMVDDQGALGAPDPAQRQQAVENHRPWIEAAKALDCHSIRVNAETGGVGTTQDQAARLVEGLRALAEFGSKHGLNVLVENHGGLSSHGGWLSDVIKAVDLPNCGTLPDFGNFRIAENREYDRYQGVSEMMPYAKAVSAKSHDFDADGQETRTDYRRMIKIVLDAGYRGYVGIEYEGERLPEPEGIRATKKLLEKVQAEFEVAANNTVTPAATAK